MRLGQNRGHRVEGGLGMREMGDGFEVFKEGKGGVCIGSRAERVSDYKRI